MSSSKPPNTANSSAAAPVCAAAHEFLRNVFRTHYLSAHIVALCFASLPSTAAAMLKENLLEEMGRSEHEPPHSQLLLDMARAVGFNQDEINQLINDARRRVALVCATRVPVATLRELCLSVLLETMSFEFMLSRCSSELANALQHNYAIPRAALRWFELHSEVDIRHAEEAITVIQDYTEFHQISDASLRADRRLHPRRQAFLPPLFSAEFTAENAQQSGPAAAR